MSKFPALHSWAVEYKVESLSPSDISKLWPKAKQCVFFCAFFALQFLGIWEFHRGPQGAGDSFSYLTGMPVKYVS